MKAEAYGLICWISGLLSGGAAVAVAIRLPSGSIPTVIVISLLAVALARLGRRVRQ